MKKFSGNEVCRILESFGFHPERQRGSHMIMQKKQEILPLQYQFHSI
jgi:predicted RNA binding protein YcfA (HicA-like mRNA interferase family)